MNKWICLLLIMLSLFSCSKKEATKASKSFSINLTSEVSTLDPANSYDNVSGTILYQVCEQLYEYHYLNRPYELKPLLAEEMPKIEDGGKRYVIKIKKNIRYHDDPSFKGKVRFVKAEDFITAIKRIAFPGLESSGSFIVDDTVVGVEEFKKIVGSDFKRLQTTPIKGVYARDEFTLVIELTKPSPRFIYKLAMSFISPTPMEAVEYYKNDLSNITVGTGPFQIKQFDRKGTIVMERFRDYHDEYYPGEGDRYANSIGLLKDSGEKLPFLDSITFRVIKDNKDRWNDFFDKKIDVLVVPQDRLGDVFDENGNLTEQLKKLNVHIQSMPTLTFWWLAFNMKDPLIGKNTDLRKAIAHAIDMDEYVKRFTKNTGQKANSIYPPGVLGYTPSQDLAYKYDVEQAKKYLEKAGFPNGKGLPEIIYDTRAESKMSNAQADFFKTQLAQVGIKLKIVKNNFNEYLEKSKSGHLVFFQDGWTLDYPDAENVLQLLSSQNHAPGPNASMYTNKEFDKLYEKIIKLHDGEERMEAMLAAQDIINQDVPWIMQYYSRNFILYHDYVKNYRPTDIVFNYLKYIRVK